MLCTQISCKRRERKIECQCETAQKYRRYRETWTMKESVWLIRKRVVLWWCTIWLAGGEQTGQCSSPPSSYPSFSPTLFSDLFCSNASQRRSRGKSAPCSRSWKQTSLWLHPNELLTELVLHSYQRKHMQILISGVQVWPFSQTQEALSHLNTSVHCNSLSLFIQHAKTASHVRENNTVVKTTFLAFGVLISCKLTLFSGFTCSICSFFFFFTAFHFKTLIPLWNNPDELFMFSPKTAVHTTREQKEWWAILACICSSFALGFTNWPFTRPEERLVSWIQHTVIHFSTLQKIQKKRKGKSAKEGKISKK